MDIISTVSLNRTNSESTESDTETNPVLRVLLAIRRSLLLFIATVGIVFLLSGATWANGVLAGMFGIWGISALLYAGLGYVLLKLIGYH